MQVLFFNPAKIIVLTNITAADNDFLFFIYKITGNQFLTAVTREKPFVTAVTREKPFVTAVIRENHFIKPPDFDRLCPNTASCKIEKDFRARDTCTGIKAF